jgi:hypothetical protein
VHEVDDDHTRDHLHHLGGDRELLGGAADLGFHPQLPTLPLLTWKGPVTDRAGTSDEGVGRRVGHHVRQPSVRVNGPEWHV